MTCYDPLMSWDTKGLRLRYECTSRTFSGKSRDKDHGPYPGIRTRRDHGPLGLWISIYRTQVSMKDLDSGYFYIHLEVSH